MYRFALRPRWIVSHLFVLALVVTMVNLGLWQIRRLDERKDDNRRIEANLSQEPVELSGLLTVRSTHAQVDGVADRRVSVTGTYEADRQILVRSRSLESNPGSWVLTPLRRDDGSIVVVNRGWIPNDGTYDAVPPAYVPPSGPVTVDGLVQQTQTRGRFGPKDPPTGRLTSLARVDVARYGKQLDGPVVPAWIQLRSEAPKPAVGSTQPTILGLPELDEGPHFSYAVQWFIFTTIALVGYPLILRRNAREKAAEAADGGDDDVDPEAQDSEVLADGRA